MSKKVSVIIPACNEIFLQKTIDDVIEKASGPIEVIVTLDGYWPDPPLKNHRLVNIIHQNRGGMRASINAAASIATGDYLLKTDAHCLFALGYDEILKANCDDNWIVIPSRYSLDAENWCIKDTGKARVDYHYLNWPYTDEPGLHGVVWNERARQRLDPKYNIDDEMSFQGSCWFMTKHHFWNNLGGMQEEGYESFIQEPQEIGLKTWLGGGRIVVNKNTFYAHLHKGKQYGRGYFIDKREMVRGAKYSMDFWMNNRWDKRVFDIEWLVEKFWPVPTWPENWVEELERCRREFKYERA